MTNKNPKIAIHIAELAKQCYLNCWDMRLAEEIIACTQRTKIKICNLDDDDVISNLTAIIHKVSGMNIPDMENNND